MNKRMTTSLVFVMIACGIFVHGANAEKIPMFTMSQVSGTAGANGCSLGVTDMQENVTLSGGKKGTRLTIAQQNCPAGVNPGTATTLEIPYGDKGETGEPGEPGIGLTYKGTLDSCDNLPGSGNSAGDFYVVNGNMCIYNGTGWPTTCPDDCTPLGANVGVDITYKGTYTAPTRMEPGKLTLTMKIDNGDPQVIYEDHADSCGDVVAAPSGAKYYGNLGDASGMVQLCTVQTMPADTTGKPNASVTEYYINAGWRWIYHQTDGVNPGFIAKHKVNADDNTVGEQISGGSSDSCNIQGASVEEFKDRSLSLLLPKGTNTCTVKNWGSSYNVDYSNSTYNAGEYSTASGHNTYTIGQANATGCYRSYEGPYQAPTNGTGAGATVCSTNTIDEPCDNRGYRQITYAYPDGGNIAPAGCSAKPEDKIEYDDCPEMVSMGGRTAANSIKNAVYKCTKRGTNDVYYWKGVATHVDIVRLHHAPVGCDVNKHKCTSRGYTVDHVTNRSGEEIRGTRQEDECKPAIPNSGDTRSVGMKCSVPVGLGNGSYETGYDGGVSYYIGDDTPIQCVTEKTAYAGPAPDDRIVVNDYQYETYTSKGKMTRTKQNICTGEAASSPEVVDDYCELIDYGKSGDQEYTDYKCDPADGGTTYIYRDFGTQPRMVSKIKQKANADDVYTKTEVDNLQPKVELEYFDSKLQYCNEGAACYNANNEPVTSKWSGVDIGGLNGKSAYELWQDAGNTGSMSEFLASLKGDTGASVYQTWLTQAGNSGKSEAQFLDDLRQTMFNSACPGGITIKEVSSSTEAVEYQMLCCDNNDPDCAVGEPD